MGCINVREGDATVSLIALDACGAPDPGLTGLLTLDTIGELTWEDNITDGDEVTERNLGGRKKYADVGCDELTSIGVSLISLGLNPALEVALLAATAKLDGSTVVGYGRNDLSCAQNVAVEVLMQLDTDACTEAGAAPIVGWLFPLVKNWRPNGGATLNGTDLLKPSYSGRGYKNQRIFDTVVEPLEKWQGIHVAGTEWFTVTLFDGAEITLPTVDCDPVELAEATS